MMIIGIVGGKGSGKDTAAKYIAQRYGGKNHSHSEIYADILTVLDVPHTRMNLINLVALRKIFGENVLINALNKKVQNENADVEVITGIRFQNEMDNVRKYPNNFVIFLDATIEKRFENQQHRAQYTDDKTMTFDEFLEIEQKETEKYIPVLKEQANAVVDNNGTFDELKTKLNAILDPIIKK